MEYFRWMQSFDDQRKSFLNSILNEQKFVKKTGNKNAFGSVTNGLDGRSS